MSRLPRISGRECVKALSKVGYYLKRQEGSQQLVVPDHRELDKGTLRAIIREAGLSPDEFAKLL